MRTENNKSNKNSAKASNQATGKNDKRNAKQAPANKLTELVFIVDRSGSMHGLERDTIGGMNSVLEKNRQLDGEVIVSTVLFDHESKVLHDRLPISRVPALTERDYQVRGCTALLDAMGGSIRHIERVQKYMPAEHKADKVIFVITTDGMENASTRYSYDKVKRAIERKTKDGWEFLFLGANIDAAAEAARLGIASDRAVEYVADGEGTHAMHESVAAATFNMRMSAERIDSSWTAPVRADRKRRGGC